MQLFLVGMVVHCPSQKHNCRKIDVSQLQGALGVMLMHQGSLVSGELSEWGAHKVGTTDSTQEFDHAWLNDSEVSKCNLN